MEGTPFGAATLDAELKLEACDSPNSASAVIDAIRCYKLALNRGLAGPTRPIGVLHEVAAAAVPWRPERRHGVLAG
jgi:myo-inositol-1-phosphate synthase